MAREGVTTASRSTPLKAESIDCAPPPPSGDADTHRYIDSIKAVFAYNPNITPQPFPVDYVFAGPVPGDAAGGASSFHFRFRAALERFAVYWGGGDGGGIPLTSRRGVPVIVLSGGGHICP